jgi:hypothetical protein
MVEEKDRLEKMEVYEDKWPCLRIRIWMKKKQITANMFCQKIIKSPIFEGLSLTIIILNSVVLAMEDPTSTEINPIFALIDDIFLGLYSVEMILKVRYSFYGRFLEWDL